jgi:hypothetical protein
VCNTTYRSHPSVPILLVSFVTALECSVCENRVWLRGAKKPLAGPDDIATDAFTGCRVCVVGGVVLTTYSYLLKHLLPPKFDRVPEDNSRSRYSRSQRTVEGLEPRGRCYNRGLPRKKRRKESCGLLIIIFVCVSLISSHQLWWSRTAWLNSKSGIQIVDFFFSRRPTHIVSCSSDSYTSSLVSFTHE